MHNWNDSTIAIAQRHYDRWAYMLRFRAEVPRDTVPAITKVIGPSKVILLKDNQTERWSFPTRSKRDQFVHAWKHIGAKNA